jgi:hypothetical protein
LRAHLRMMDCRFNKFRVHRFNLSSIVISEKILNPAYSLEFGEQHIL